MSADHYQDPSFCDKVPIGTSVLGIFWLLLSLLEGFAHLLTCLRIITNFKPLNDQNIILMILSLDL